MHNRLRQRDIRRPRGRKNTVPTLQERRSEIRPLQIPREIKRLAHEHAQARLLFIGTREVVPIRQVDELVLQRGQGAEGDVEGVERELVGGGGACAVVEGNADHREGMAGESPHFGGADEWGEEGAAAGGARGRGVGRPEHGEGAGDGGEDVASSFVGGGDEGCAGVEDGCFGVGGVGGGGEGVDVDVC